MEPADYSVMNVWWKGKERIAEDKHIRDFFAKKYQWAPEILSDSERERLVPGNIFTLRGPRQVGKTTHVKLLIKKLLESGDCGVGVPEKAIFYASCDTIMDFNELLKLVRGYLEFANSGNIRTKFIFLDEISGIEDWQKAIKLLADTGELKDVCLYLTGSHTLDIKYGFERLPGRTGKQGRDYILLPLSFGEFVKLIRPEIYEKIKRVKILSVSEINKAANSAMPYDRDLKVLFNQYLTTGGFPLSINEFYAENRIPDYVYDVYMRWIASDIVKWGKQEKILNQILRTAVLKQGTAVSWDSFAKDAEVKSHKTVSSYIEDLENMFVVFVLYFLDIDKKSADYGKNKKIYFFDPLIYHLFNKMFYFKNTEITPSLIEATAAVHFARFGGAQLGNPVGSAFYWKNKKETDIVVRTKDALFAVEVKYQEKISTDDFSSLYHFKEGGVVATKSLLVLDKKYSAVPVHLLLAAL